jgi:hypothetical protein
MSFVVFTLIWSRRGLRGRLAALGVEVPKDLLDAIAALDRFVEKELQLGDAPEADPLPDLPAQKRGDTLEGAARFLARLLVAQGCVVDARLLQIGRDFDSGDGQEPDARILDDARQEIGDLDSQLVPDAPLTG